MTSKLSADLNQEASLQGSFEPLLQEGTNE
ncbi:hypothetical protein [Borreliella garinii]